MSMTQKIYNFDQAATTALNPSVFSAMEPYFKDRFGNPSSLHQIGHEVNLDIKSATQIVAQAISGRPDEIVYCGSATEADNLAIIGTARANRHLGNRIIISPIEHKGIISACQALEKDGFEIITLPLKENGLIDMVELKNAINEKTILISITSADSETGTIQPIKEIAQLIKSFKQNRRLLKNNDSTGVLIDSEANNEINLPYFHTDASQAFGFLNINVKNLGLDLMTISGHKINGPKGIGVLYVKHGLNVEPIIHGGGQQEKIRSGTENVPAIIGLAEAVKILEKNKARKFKAVKKLRDILEREIFKTIPKVVLNGHKTKRLPNFLNVSILDIEGEALLLRLDNVGILASTGSACNSQSLEPSYVLTALGNSYEYIHGSIRFSLGYDNTLADIKYLLKHLPKIVSQLRAISPLNIGLGNKKTISLPQAFIANQSPHFLRKKSHKFKK